MEDRLIKFAHLIDAGSFTKAAHDLHISQPALSMAMHKLEKELRTQLYVRGSQPLTPTTAGSYAYKSAKELSSTLRYLHMDLAALAQQEVALSLGLIDSMADLLLSQKRTFQTLEEHARVSLVINNSRYLLELLRRGAIDVACIVEQGRLLDAQLTMRYIGSEPLVVVVHAKQLAHITGQLRAKTLTSYISYDQPSFTHAQISQFFADHAVTLEPQFFSSSPDAILALVLAQEGAAALPMRKIESYIKRGILLPVRLGSESIITRRIICVTRQNYVLPAVVQETMHRLTADVEAMLRAARQL